MSLKIGKRFAFLCLLILCAVGAHVVSAQNKNAERISAAESQPKISQIEVETVSEKSHVNKTNEPPHALQINDRRDERSIFENKGSVEIVENETAPLDAQLKNEINDFAYRFPSVDGRKRQINFGDATFGEKGKLSFPTLPVNFRSPDDPKNVAPSDNSADVKTESFRWRSAIGQSLMFLAVQHGYAFTQPKTREAMKGKFWKDYVKSVKSLHGWADGGRFFTNYIAHPMQGAFLGYIQVQNDPRGLKQQFGTSKDYWRSRLKALAWSAAWSTQFEIGPISQASIGNVGLKGKQTYIDIVITPTVGTAWLVAEDAIDRFVIKRIERATDNFYVKMFSRGLLNPMRTIANVFRFKTPWHRDRPRAQ